MSTIFDGVSNDVARTAVAGMIPPGAAIQVGNRPSHPFLPVRTVAYYTGIYTGGTAPNRQISVWAGGAYYLWATMMQAQGVDVTDGNLDPLWSGLSGDIRVQLMREVEFHLVMSREGRGRVSPQQSHLYWVEAARLNGWRFQQWPEATSAATPPAPPAVDTANKRHHLVTADWRAIPREMQLRYEILDAYLHGGLLKFAEHGQSELGISGGVGRTVDGVELPTANGVVPANRSNRPAWTQADSGLRGANCVM